MGYDEDMTLERKNTQVLILSKQKKLDKEEEYIYLVATRYLGDTEIFYKVMEEKELDTYQKSSCWLG